MAYYVLESFEESLKIGGASFRGIPTTGHSRALSKAVSNLTVLATKNLTVDSGCSGVECLLLSCRSSPGTRGGGRGALIAPELMP